MPQCSDIFLIPCWSGEVLPLALALDCHDREIPAWGASQWALTGADIRALMDRILWARFGEATLTAPHAVKWLSANGPQYTATASVCYAHELGLEPITTPAYSPQSNGLAEAVVQTFKRDYVHGAELRDAESVLAQRADWFDDYNRRAPHSALGIRPPVECRASLEFTPPIFLGHWRADHAPRPPSVRSRQIDSAWTFWQDPPTMPEGSSALCQFRSGLRTGFMLGTHLCIRPVGRPG